MQKEAQALPTARQVRGLARVATMYPRSRLVTARATREFLGGNNGHGQHVIHLFKCYEFQSIWQSEGGLHFHPSS